MPSAFRLFPDSGSTIAHHVDNLFLFLTITSSAIALLVFILIVSFTIRFRRRPGDRRIPAQTRTYTSLELSWTFGTFLLAMVMFVWGAELYVRIVDVPKDSMTVYVVGKQWMWKVQHPEGHREINELHVPVGRPVKLVMSSQDVIHDFFVPAFRVKHDVLPGRYTSLWFTATKPGKFRFFCSQYCGAGHATMVGQVIAMEPSRYQAWLADTVPEQTPAQAGGRLFIKLGCASCHGVNAPTLAGLYGSTVHLQGGGTTTADEHYIRDSILNSTNLVVEGYAPVMPSYRGQLSEEQMLQLLEYIKLLKNPAAEEGRVKKP